MGTPKKPDGLPADKIRWNSERQVWEIWHEMFERNPDNPRSSDEYIPPQKYSKALVEENDNDNDDVDEENGKGAKAMANLMASIYAKEFGGVHQPLSAYIDGGRAHLLDGHRRQAAVSNLCELYPDNAKELGWIPTNLEPIPDTRVKQKIKMLSSNNLKKGWNFREDLKNFKNFIGLCKDEGYDINDDTTKQEMAAAIGWNGDRLDAMIEIANSPALCAGVYNEDFKTTTYKTWRGLYLIQKVLLGRENGRNRYVSMLEDVLGIKRTAKDFKERLYQRLVTKTLFYVKYSEQKAGKSQAGAILERIPKPLRNPLFPVERVRQWLITDVYLTPWSIGRDFSVERPTESSRRNDNEARFLAVWTTTRSKLSEDELQNLMSQCVFDEHTQTYNLPKTAQTEKMANVPKVVESKANTWKNGRSSKAVPNSRRIFNITVPNKSTSAFNHLKRQLMELLTSKEVKKVITSEQQKIFDQIVVLLK